MLAKIGPWLKKNSLVFESNTLEPTISPGSRSGVNWMRQNLALMLLASALPTKVLPTPGTSSNKTCSPDNSAATHSRMTRGFPSTTFAMFASSSPTRLCNSGVISTVHAKEFGWPAQRPRRPSTGPLRPGICTPGPPRPGCSPEADYLYVSRGKCPRSTPADCGSSFQPLTFGKRGEIPRAASPPQNPSSTIPHSFGLLLPLPASDRAGAAGPCHGETFVTARHLLRDRPRLPEPSRIRGPETCNWAESVAGRPNHRRRHIAPSAS